MRSGIFLLAALLAATVLPASAEDYYVNGAIGDDSWDGLSPLPDATHGPKATIQAGLDTASGGDTVHVADWVYTGALNKNLDFGGKALTLRSENGAGSCVIDCEGSGRGFTFHSGESAGSVVDGFTITNGDADDGGGIYCLDSDPTILNCTIRGNLAREEGGGICCVGSSPAISNCTITGNTASYGGGINCENGSSPQIADCTISANTAFCLGGGVYCFMSSPTLARCMISMNIVSGTGGGGINCYLDSNAVITDCTITMNVVGSWGGGIRCWGSNPTVTSCLIANNAAACGGGISCQGESSPTIINCTVSGNTASSVGGGLYCVEGSNPMIMNCILWGDSPAEVYVESATAHVTYCDVQGGWTGPGNMDADPLFVHGPLHDYYLSQIAAGQAADSPCVDAGWPRGMPLPFDGITTRTDGAPDTAVIDMGYHAPYALWIDSVARDSDAVTIHWNALAGVGYVVEWSVDRETWHKIPVGQVTQWTDADTLAYPRKYYRVREQ